MPLQNRVEPDGAIVATPERGLFMGNRGGQFHDAETRTLAGRSRWKTKNWICCALQFNDYPTRKLMGPGSYTELFFLDEVTSLAAGHRPCFECRRRTAVSFAEIWKKSLGGSGRMMVAEMDKILHSERCSAKTRPPEKRAFEDAPDGTVFHDGGRFLARHQGRALLWSLKGYQPTDIPTGEVEVVTPPSIVEHVLAAGYAPEWHPSADQ